MAARHLVVLRHAKAEPEAASDAQRALAPRGRRDAAATGEWLAAHGFTPEVALVSSAVRTQQTWQEAGTAAGWSTQAQSERGLYSAVPEEVVRLLHTVPDQVSSVLVVGHNPTMAHLVQLLDDGAGPVEVRSEVGARFPTCALAWFEVESSWLQLEFGTARLVDQHRP